MIDQEGHKHDEFVVLVTVQKACLWIEVEGCHISNDEQRFPPRRPWPLERNRCKSMLKTCRVSCNEALYRHQLISLGVLQEERRDSIGGKEEVKEGAMANEKLASSEDALRTTEKKTVELHVEVNIKRRWMQRRILRPLVLKLQKRDWRRISGSSTSPSEPENKELKSECMNLMLDASQAKIVHECTDGLGIIANPTQM